VVRVSLLNAQLSDEHFPGAADRLGLGDRSVYLVQAEPLARRRTQHAGPSFASQSIYGLDLASATCGNPHGD
jgi:hypothetical protein